MAHFQLFQNYTKFRCTYDFAQNCKVLLVLKISKKLDRHNHHINFIIIIMIIIISSSTCYNRILYLVRRIGIKFPETERTLRSLSAAHIPGTDLTLLGSNRETAGVQLIGNLHTCVLRS